jgi:hypothetical protein
MGYYQVLAITGRLLLNTMQLGKTSGQDLPWGLVLIVAFL